MTRGREAPARQQYVYFVQQGEDGPIKIGLSVDPEKRLSSLQVSTSEPLYLRAATPGDWSVEEGLHQHFAHLHIQGEWFRPGPDLLRLLAYLGDFYGERTRRVVEAIRPPATPQHRKPYLWVVK